MFVLYVKSTDEYVVTYNVEQGNVDSIPQNTILVHRKKETNTLYTINALNDLIKKLNGGVVDPSYRVNWQHYRNCILLTNMKKADNFDAKQWLVENKITTQSRLNENEALSIPKSLVSKMVNMKSRFGNKAGDPTIKAKLIPIITDFFPKNQDISFQELEDKFGEETAKQTVKV